jgi:hypothetical protein
MKPSAAGAIAVVSLALLSGLAFAGTGVGKGSPPSTEPDAVQEPTEAMPQSESSPPENAGTEAEPAPTSEAPATPTFDAASLSMSGTVANLYANSMSFSCHCGSGDWLIATSPGTVFQKDGNLASFADLVPGAEVTIQYHFAGKSVVTDRVVIAP